MVIGPVQSPYQYAAIIQSFICIRMSFIKMSLRSLEILALCEIIPKSTFL